MKFPSVHYLETGILHPVSWVTSCGLSAWRVRVANFLPAVTCYQCKTAKQSFDDSCASLNLDMFHANNNHGPAR